MKIAPGIKRRLRNVFIVLAIYGVSVYCSHLLSYNVLHLPLATAPIILKILWLWIFVPFTLGSVSRAVFLGICSGLINVYHYIVYGTTSELEIRKIIREQINQKIKEGDNT